MELSREKMSILKGTFQIFEKNVNFQIFSEEIHSVAIHPTGMFIIAGLEKIIFEFRELLVYNNFS